MKTFPVSSELVTCTFPERGQGSYICYVEFEKFTSNLTELKEKLVTSKGLCSTVSRGQDSFNRLMTMQEDEFRGN